MPDSSLAAQQPTGFPEPAVGVLIIHPVDDKILLLKSKRWENQYRVPRTHIVIGDTIEDTIRRVVRQELGIEVEILSQIATQESIFSEEFANPHHFIFLDYVVRAKLDSESGKVNLTTSDFVWVEPWQAVDLTMNESTRALVEAYLKKIRE